MRSCHPICKMFMIILFFSYKQYFYVYVHAHRLMHTVHEPMCMHLYVQAHIYSFVHSFIYSGYFYSASSLKSTTILRGAPDTARIPRRSFTQLRVKDLPKVPTWQLERDSNPRPFGRKVSNLPMGHHAQIYNYIYTYIM